jgi:hypothetical protein
MTIKRSYNGDSIMYNFINLAHGRCLAVILHCNEHGKVV